MKKRKNTALCEFLYQFDIAYGGEVMALDKSKIIDLIKSDLECLVYDQREELRHAYESGQDFGRDCTFNAYYRLKYLGDKP